MRKRKAEGTDDRKSCCMDGHIDKTASGISAAKNRAVWKGMIANHLGKGA